MKFFYIYKALAHPEHNGYVQPYTQKERLLHVKEAQRTLGSKFSWICDTMKNELKHSLGGAPNSEFIIGPDLKVLKKRRWSDPDQLRQDLEELVGKVDKPTRVADLNMKTQSPPKAAAKGVVKRIELPRNLRAVRIVPIGKTTDQPFYAKLRAEADFDLLGKGSGKMYLAFHMDPIYNVHWNNLTKPIKVTLEPPEGMKLSTTTLNGPKVKQEADADPREFLIDIEGKTNKPLKLSAYYFACNDEAGWCKPIKQEYLVYIESDRDAGRAMRRGSRGGFAGRGRPGGGRPGGGPPGGGRAGGATMSRIASVDLKKQTVTVTSRDRKQKTYKIGNDARLIRDQRPAKLKDFRSGDMVMLRLEKDSIVGMFARTGRGGPGGGRFGGPPGGQGGPRGPRGGAGGQGGPGGGNVDDMVKRIFGLDANKDGKLTKQEIGTRGARMFERGDTNKDGFLTKEELTKAMKSIRGRGASGGRPPRE